ncbi:DUF559 domain-containing protein [Isoptericola sp. S6320L]|uniref:DUF559 domain-containing protein n=1 Tax=Isoptericola sp. S6320L TaxID=2926411 RepID=UPI001FF1B214|nr:DUF559 domain-containing protein [Isoptericola sp. S6320L]MCK0118871.1 DUF559 domain-containing protein [Isoptericola sp. S6320L]
MATPDPGAASPFSVRTALARGTSAESLRVGDALTAPFHGVRVPGPRLDDFLTRCRALATVLDSSVAFSHGTALRLLGVDVPWTMAGEDALHVISSNPAERAQRPGVVAHRSRQESLDVVDVGGLRVTAPAQTFVHVAVGLRRPDDVVVLGDSFLRRKRMLTSVAEMARKAESTRKVKGIAQVREQLSRVRPGTDSVMETRTRLLLTGAGLPCPQVNEVVWLADGTYVKRCDLLYPDHQVVIEYDGDQHRTDKEQWRDDVRRRRWLEELGLTVIVAVADDIVRDGTRLVERTRRALR